MNFSKELKLKLLKINSRLYFMVEHKKPHHSLDAVPVVIAGVGTGA